jgi:hypothetical protein
MDDPIDRLMHAANAHPGLVHRGRRLDTNFLLDSGNASALVQIRAGRVESVCNGPFVMPSWDFALRASREEWAQFWLPVPPPGHHDLRAMIKRRALRLEGNVTPFMTHLFYFKALLASVRPGVSLSAIAPLPCDPEPAR